MTDPVADMLTRIRNAIVARHEKTVLPASKLKLAIAHILREEGYIGDVIAHEEGPQGTISIVLKYLPDGTPAIRTIERRSRPGRRYYVGKSDIPRVLGGMGTTILTTSRGVMSGRQARRMGLGGEVLCTVY